MRIDTDKIHSWEKFELSWVNYLFSQNILKGTYLFTYAINLLFNASLIYNNISREKYVRLFLHPSMVSTRKIQEYYETRITLKILNYCINKNLLENFGSWNHKTSRTRHKVLKVKNWDLYNNFTVCLHFSLETAVTIKFLLLCFNFFYCCTYKKSSSNKKKSLIQENYDS